MMEVTRLLRYSYPDRGRMENDMSHWNAPAQGSKRHGDLLIESTIILPRHLEREIDPPQTDQDFTTDLMHDLMLELDHLHIGPGQQEIMRVVILKHLAART